MDIVRSARMHFEHKSRKVGHVVRHRRIIMSLGMNNLEFGYYMTVSSYIPENIGEVDGREAILFIIDELLAIPAGFKANGVDRDKILGHWLKVAKRLEREAVA